MKVSSAFTAFENLFNLAEDFLQKQIICRKNLFHNVSFVISGPDYIKIKLSGRRFREKNDRQGSKKDF